MSLGFTHTTLPQRVLFGSGRGAEHLEAEVRRLDARDALQPLEALGDVADLRRIVDAIGGRDHDRDPRRRLLAGRLLETLPRLHRLGVGWCEAVGLIHPIRHPTPDHTGEHDEGDDGQQGAHRPCGQ